MPDYCAYLAVLLAGAAPHKSSSQHAEVSKTLQSLSAELRAMAGLILKNELKANLHAIDAKHLAFVQDAILAALADEHEFVRKTAANAASTLFCKRRAADWPQLLQHIGASLGSDAPPATLEGGLQVLRLLVEDGAGAELDAAGDFLDERVTPRLFVVAAAAAANGEAQFGVKMQNLALASINQLIYAKPATITHNLPLLLHILSTRAAEKHAETRRLVCRALTAIAECYYDAVAPAQMAQIMDFMLEALRDADPSVALDACEFWLAAPENEAQMELLMAKMPLLLPLLLDAVVYAPDDASLAFNAQEEEDKDDGVDGRGHCSRPKTHGAQSHQSTQESDDEESDDDDEDEDASQWNLRRCAASTIDLLASTADPDAFLHVLLPLLQTRLAAPQWEVRESAILVLGAIAEGCSEAMQPHLPQLLPFLLENTAHPKPLVRAIAFWTMGRWGGALVAAAATNQNADEGVAFLHASIWAMLRAMQQPNRKVQAAAASVLGVLARHIHEADGGRRLLQPCVEEVVRVAADCIANRFTSRNRIIAFNAVTAVAECAGEGGALGNSPAAVSALLPALLAAWAACDEACYTEIFTCMECVSALIVATTAAACGVEMLRAIYAKCVRLMRRVLQPASAADADVDFDVAVVAIDVVCNVAVSMRNAADSALFAVFDGAFVELLLGDAVKHAYATIRQAAYGCLGDVMRVPTLRRHFIDVHVECFLAGVVPNVDPLDAAANAAVSMSAANNAIWALGEYFSSLHAAAAAATESVTPSVLAAVHAAAPHLIAVLACVCEKSMAAASKGGDRTALQPPSAARRLALSACAADNLSVAMGRIALVSPDALAPAWRRLMSFFFAHVTSPSLSTVEREEAWVGACRTVALLPAAAFDAASYGAMLAAYAAFPTPPSAALQAFFADFVGRRYAQATANGIS